MPRPVPAARATMEILRLLSAIDTPISASRIIAEVGLPRSTAYQILAEMVDAGFVVHLPEHQTYGLGLAAYDMASAYATQQPLVRLCTKPLQEAAAMVSGSGHLSRLAGSEIVYLQEVRAPGAVSLVTQRGVRLQAHRTASGRSMLARLPEKEIRAAYETSGEVGLYRAVQEELKLTRERGWGYENQEVARGQASVAVAIVDHVQRPAGALAVTYPIGVQQSTIYSVVEFLQHKAAEVARKMYKAD